MGGGSGGGGGDSQTTYRFAPYLEDAHARLISYGWNYATPGSGLFTSPYASYTVPNPDDGFFGTGYVLASFPSLYDMFGKFVAGLDVEALYSQIYSDTVTSPITNDLIAAHSSNLQDDIDQVAWPRIAAGMRDIGAVMSSSFITARTQLQAQKAKAVTDFAARVKTHAMDITVQRWGRHLEWNSHTIEQYRSMIQLYFAAKSDYINTKSEIDSRNILWPFTVLEHQRVIIGTLNGAGGAAVKGDSKVAKAIGGVMSGAAMGAMVGNAVPGIGTAMGAVAGGVLGLAGGLF
jgi:hypothetical protein